jgi:hypothetical protein
VGTVAPLPMNRLAPARSPRLLRLVFALSLAGAAACDPLPGSPGAHGPGRPLPSYAGHATVLFDDTIEPAAVGITLDVGVDPRTDRLLRERVQVGDSTSRVRVTTVTAKEEDNGTRYVVGLKSLEPLAGHFPQSETFEVTVGKSSPSTGILKGLDGQIVGKTFVGFVRAFVRPDGDPEVHFHLAPDSKDEIAAVKDAAVLSGL